MLALFLERQREPFFFLGVLRFHIARTFEHLGYLLVDAARRDKVFVERVRLDYLIVIPHPLIMEGFELRYFLIIPNKRNPLDIVGFFERGGNSLIYELLLPFVLGYLALRIVERGF